MTAALKDIQIAQALKPKEYKSEVTPVWCAGCGYFGILSGFYRALSELKIDPRFLVNISGIGCSSRTPYFVKSYKMHTLHGRAGAVATGTQLARPDLMVVVTGGDGDGFSIGGGHMPHMARKNVNMTYILMDNHIYGLTKGQVSPTSRYGMKTYTTPHGNPDDPMNPLLYMLTYGATYVAQGFAGKPTDCANLVKEALEHKGFFFVFFLSQCPSFNYIDTVKYFRDFIKPLPEDHDSTDLDNAMSVVNKYTAEGRAPTGVLYKVERDTLDKRMVDIVEKVGGSPDYDMRKVINLSRP